MIKFIREIKFVIIFLLVVFFFISPTYSKNVIASAENINEALEQKIIRFTDSDFLDGDNTLTIRNNVSKYIKSIKFINKRILISE